MDMALVCFVVCPGSAVKHVEMVLVCGGSSVIMVCMLLWAYGFRHILPFFAGSVHVIPSLGAAEMAAPVIAVMSSYNMKPWGHL
jgi:hypothetical protein